MAGAADINESWSTAAAALEAREPARYAACARAVAAGENWKAMLARLSLADGTARGVHILENRKSTPPHRRWYNG